MKFTTEAKTFLRSLFLQSCWNFEGMQNIGFAFSISPLLEKIYKDDKPGLRAALKRHMEFFNTQPFMSSIAIGLTAKMEENLRIAPQENREENARRLRDIKSAISTATAAIGDRLFWGTLRPLSLCVAIFIWTIAGAKNWIFSGNTCGFSVHIPDYYSKVIFCGILAGLALYNSFALWARWKGIGYGYHCGETNACGMDFCDWQKLIRIMRLCAFFLCLATVIAAGYTFIIATLSQAPCLERTACLLIAPASFILAFVVKRLGYLNMYLYGAVVIASYIFFHLARS